MSTTLTPAIAIHLTAALAAVALGPVALWARKGQHEGRAPYPRLHRAFGYAWVTMMLLTALSAMWIRSHIPWSIAGFSWIHLFVPITILSLALSFRALARGDANTHRLIMQRVYVGACLVAGAFTLLPGRYLGDLVRQAF